MLELNLQNFYLIAILSKNLRKMVIKLQKIRRKLLVYL